MQRRRPDDGSLKHNRVDAGAAVRRVPGRRPDVCQVVALQVKKADLSVPVQDWFQLMSMWTTLPTSEDPYATAACEARLDGDGLT